MPQVMKVTDPFAEVKTIIPSIEGRASLSKQCIMVKDDKGVFQEAGWVSPDYNLIPNERAHGILDDICTRSKFGFHQMRPDFFDGKRYVAYRMSDEPLFEIKNGLSRTGKVGIACLNSYDGSTALRIQMFVAFLECLNQNHYGNRFGNFSIKHIINGDGEGDVNFGDALEQIQLGANRLMNAAPLFQRLTSVDLDMDLLRAAKAATDLGDSHWGAVIDHIETDSAWGLQNAMTNVASHKLKGIRSIQVGNSIGEAFLNEETGILKAA